MTPEERSKRFWKIREKNDKANEKAAKRAALRKHIDDNHVIISIGIGALIGFIILFVYVICTTPEKNESITYGPTFSKAKEETSAIALETAEVKTVSLNKETEAVKETTPEIRYENIAFSKVNVRSKKSTDSEIIDTLESGELVGVIQDEGEWILVLKNNHTGYVKSDYLGSMIEYKKYNAVQEKAFTNLNIRKGPSKDSEVAFKLDKGSNIQVVATEEPVNGFVQVIYQDKIFYASEDYLGNESEYTEYQKSLDKTPYNDYLISHWGFDKDKQKYLWGKAQELYPKDPNHCYAYLLAVIQRETDFGRDKSNWNSNGTRDLGIMQVNSSNWKELKNVGIITEYNMSNKTCDELQYNDYIGIDAGCYFLNKAISKYGLTEKAYWHYNTGKTSGSGSNKNSKVVWTYYQEWLKRLYQE